MSELYILLLASLAVLFIGVSKAGFGGGLGMLTTPLCVVAFTAMGKPSSFAIGVLLPLLCAGDLFSLWHYWGKWERRNLVFLLPGVVVGVLVGVQLVNRLSPQQLNLAIGVLAVSFVAFQLVKERVFAAEGTFAPNHAVGIPCGIGAGITSSVAHGAGPLVAVFLIPQRLPKEVYVSTHILIFTCINLIKLPFFFANKIITRETLLMDVRLVALVPLGVWLGVWLNRRFSEKDFVKVIYTTTLLAGVYLIYSSLSHPH